MPRLLLAALAIVGSLAALPEGASAKDRPCPAKAGTVAKSSYGRLWHAKGALYGCSTVYGRAPRVVRLGPWRGGAHVAFDGVAAAWTTPLTRDGVRRDRVWVASLDSGRRWISGARAVPASPGGPAREARVTKLFADFEGVAWVTAGSDVVLALHDAQAPPAVVGALPAALQPSDRYLLVGSWPATPAADLAASVALHSTSEDGDECGGVDLYQLTVQPQGSTDSVGATWDGAWERTNCG